MTIQEQLHHDVDLTSADPIAQKKALSFFANLKKQQPNRGNMQAVLALAGTLDNESAQEISELINNEFGKNDGEWH
jgi:hypothetical protein